jgi:glycosyltransferase involved in cell wall biosynthesis
MIFQQCVPPGDMQHLRVGIDGRPLQGEHRGDGRYVFELCRELDKRLPNAEFFVYSSVPVEMPVLSDRWILRTDLSLFSKLPPLLWLKVRGWYFCWKDRLDVFWGTNTFLPRLPSTVRKVVTVHDFYFQITPENFPVAHLWTNRLFFIKDVHRADIVLANSVGTSERVSGLVAYRPSVISPSVEKAFKPQSNDKIAACLKIYDISYPYILNVAVWEPRKNIELLVKTFISMKKEGLLSGHKLVLVGKKGWRYKSIATMVTSDGGKHVVSLGFVPDEYLPPLYAGADVFVFPSLYEGYGMPVLEARVCGTRVVASDIPELREAGGADTIYIRPTEKGIRNGILTALKQAPKCRAPLCLPTWEDGSMLLAAALCGEKQPAW